jgi:putative ATP-binding cassette transporter
MAFMPPRPYFPLGTLRAALLYPHPERTVPDETVRDILMRCGHERLIARLDETDQWGSILSPAEQQLFSFARVLIHPPDILIMDEPTSSLDELSQFRMMEYVRDLLPRTTVIHAGHRQGLERFHDRAIHLVLEARAASVPPPEQRASRLKIVARALKKLERERSASGP